MPEPSAQLVAATPLLLLTLCGFALLVSGFARARNVVHATLGIIVIYNVALLGAWAAGYAVQAHGSPFLPDIDSAPAARFLVMALIGAVAAVIPAGALVQRWRLASMALVSLAVSAAIYPLVARWIWSDGWAAQLGVAARLGHGVVDVAGSGVVHLVGGMAALAGTRVLGPRVRKFDRDGQPLAMPGHHVPMFMIGTLLIATGWFGMLLARSDAGPGVPLAAASANLALASAASVLSAIGYMCWRFGTPDPSLVCNALVAGLVSMSAGCAFVSSTAAVFIGAVSGPLVVQAVILVERGLRADDPAGAISTHGICGIWGLLAVGLFADGRMGNGWHGVAGPVRGLFYGDGSQLVAQAGGALAIALFAFAASYLAFVVIGRTIGNRVAAEAEIEGLDVAELGTTAYPDFGVSESGVDSRL